MPAKTPVSYPPVNYLLAALVGLAIAGHAAAEPSGPSLIDKGKYLTTAGDCVACHTVPGGKPFAGGAALDTPFGKIYPPNITPDKKTGIGDWSDDDFYRALHEGLDKEGHYLYPAFPFPWYTKITRDDVMAIKAYIFSLPPVDRPDKPLDFAFPFDVREGLAAWRGVFFKAGEFKPDPGQSPQWNRGAYLVEGLGHCGECHNKSNLMGTSELAGRLQGGVIEGWYAPALTAKGQQGLGNWSESDLVTYLKTGFAPGKGVVVGPMKQTIQDSLSHLKDDDLHAIAVYLKSAPTDTNAPPADVADTVKTPGAEAYLTHCAYCHLPDGHGRKGAISSLAGNGAVDAGGPEDVIRIVLGGLPASHGLGPMPAVGVGLDDQKIADIVNFVRQSWGNHAPANADGAMVAKLRAETKTVMALNLAGGCKTVDDPALAKAVAQPAIKNALSDRKRPLLDRIDAIVPKVKAAAPGATNDAIVNALSDAYCPVVMADTSASAADRIEDFGTFSGLVYGRLAGRPDRS